MDYSFLTLGGEPPANLPPGERIRYPIRELKVLLPRLESVLSKQHFSAVSSLCEEGRVVGDTVRYAEELSADLTRTLRTYEVGYTQCIRVAKRILGKTARVFRSLDVPENIVHRMITNYAANLQHRVAPLVMVIKTDYESRASEGVLFGEEEGYVECVDSLIDNVNNVVERAEKTRRSNGDAMAESDPEFVESLLGSQHRHFVSLNYLLWRAEAIHHRISNIFEATPEEHRELLAGSLSASTDLVTVIHYLERLSLDGESFVCTPADYGALNIVQEISIPGLQS